MSVSLTPSQIDMATALEISVNDPLIESKINALKTLHAKKIKSLMGVIDQSKKEIDKMKILTKDNRRTQMIQILKNKQRDLELIIDILKEKFVEDEVGPPDDKAVNSARRRVELEEKRKAILERINNLIISKTVAKGPKRFRPQTREEMELKINELERKLAKLTSTATAAASTPAAASTADTKAVRSEQAKPAGVAKTPQKATGTRSSSSIPTNANANANGDDAGKDASSHLEFQQMVAKLQGQREEMAQLREEITRLRRRNTELRLNGEEIVIKDHQINEVREVNDRLQDELLDLTQRLAISREEVAHLSMEAERDREVQQKEFLEMQTQCEQLLRQNALLLRRMADVEREAANKTGKLPVASTDSGAQDREKLAKLEVELENVSDKLSSAEDEIKRLNVAHELKVNKLLDSIREVQVQNKDLLKAKKELEEQVETRDAEVNKLKMRPTSGSTSTGKSGAAISVYEQAVDALVMYAKKTVQKLLGKGLVVSPPPALQRQLESLLKVASGNLYRDLSELIALLERITDPEHLDGFDVLELSDSRETK